MIRALLIALLALGLLAGCGGDDNKSADTTTTSTVPQGRLGATNRCEPPSVDGYAIRALDTYSTSCDDAADLLKKYLTAGGASAIPTHSCNRRQGNPGVDLICVMRADRSRGFRADYTAN